MVQSTSTEDTLIGDEMEAPETPPLNIKFDESGQKWEEYITEDGQRYWFVITVFVVFIITPGLTEKQTRANGMTAKSPRLALYFFFLT